MLSTLPAGTIARRVRAGELRAEAVAAAALERIGRLDPGLCAFLTVTADTALARAREIDALVAQGRDPGPLAGVPVAVKDNLCTAGIRTTCGSRMLESYVPPYDATVVERLREAGATLVGKTNLDEFAMGSSTENSAFFPTRNPWAPDRVPGGSSGGSAAAVAGGLATLALGSDTGGSVRQPASFTGLFGLKPTYGRVSRYGLVAFASSLDQVGMLSRDLEGLGLLYTAIAGHDPRDATSAPRLPEAVEVTSGVRGLRIGVASGFLDRSGVEPAVAAAVGRAGQALAQAGAVLGDAALPSPEVAVSAYYLLAPAEASSNLARYDGVRYGLRVPGKSLSEVYRGTRSRGFGDEVKRRILLGTYTLAAGYYEAYYLRAQRTRGELRRSSLELLRHFDLLLLPTAPTTAFHLGEKAGDPLAMYLADVFTVFANLTGLPAISVPMGRDAKGLPIGVQLMAGPWREDLLWRAAAALEAACPAELCPLAGEVA